MAKKKKKKVSKLQMSISRVADRMEGLAYQILDATDFIQPGSPSYGAMSVGDKQRIAAILTSKPINKCTPAIAKPKKVKRNITAIIRNIIRD
jgi:hypothetical protein